MLEGAQLGGVRRRGAPGSRVPCVRSAGLVKPCCDPATDLRSCLPPWDPSTTGPTPSSSHRGPLDAAAGLPVGGGRAAAAQPRPPRHGSHAGGGLGSGLRVRVKG